MWSTHSLPLLPRPLLYGVVVHVRVSCMGQRDLFKIFWNIWYHMTVSKLFVSRIVIWNYKLLLNDYRYWKSYNWGQISIGLENLIYLCVNKWSDIESEFKKNPMKHWNIIMITIKHLWMNQISASIIRKELIGWSKNQPNQTKPNQTWNKFLRLFFRCPIFQHTFNLSK